VEDVVLEHVLRGKEQYLLLNAPRCCLCVVLISLRCAAYSVWNLILPKHLRFINVGHSKSSVFVIIICGSISRNVFSKLGF
jgi:hypothetical protein